LTCVAVAGVLGAATPASAQFYEETRRLLDLAPDPLARTPRLASMGRLTLVGEDVHYRLNLWDYAGNPAGLLDSDSTSSFEVRPATSSANADHQLMSTEDQVRQDLSLREFRFAAEAWNRNGETVAWGAVADVGLLGVDRPWGHTLAQEREFTEPSAMPIVSGAMPYIFEDRMRYALRFITASESADERYRNIVSNAAGDWVNQDGDIQSPPNFFVPVDYEVRTLGWGAATAFRVSPELSAAIGFDKLGKRIDGTNAGPRHSADIDEERPYTLWQGSLSGRVSRAFEWGADARSWNSKSHTNWRFTLSTGPASAPVAGRGNLLDRREKGSSFRTRVRWIPGGWVFGGSFDTAKNRVDIEAPPASDASSFNRYRNTLYNTTDLDTLVLPDSIVTNEQRERSWTAAGGAGYSFGRTFVGAEFHLSEDRYEQDIGGTGPERRRWDVRAGAEF
jgi:hypothetical protein